MAHDAEIIDLLQQNGYTSVKDLAAHVGVTPSTVRRTLDRLEGMDLVQRTHGGAYPTQTADTPYAMKETLHQREKAAIGRAMADRILEGQTVLLDSGSTTLEVAKHLRRSRLTVVTNDLRIGLEIANKPGMHLMFIGGELLPNVYTMWGPTAVEQLTHLRVDVAVFGADTVDDDGVYNASSYEVELKRTMLSITREAFLVADSSKFGREALFQVFDFEKFTAGITDSTLDPLRASHFPIPLITVKA
ncbi:DeoR/GlpR family DNA-binding transcription regulator [Microbacterium sp. G2-8]|uniref:DeoR/GlpR family DNA-binding transcription regulator n=1 Tax=Microbacterium sp. G2-8 TaxID=2842454 RepID=UPI001C8A6019|nr:DeoR/GlpR family DNA-binding transcription regulator [Microbacterium sp. G2-8]